MGNKSTKSSRKITNITITTSNNYLSNVTYNSSKSDNTLDYPELKEIINEEVLYPN